MQFCCAVASKCSSFISVGGKKGNTDILKNLRESELFNNTQYTIYNNTQDTQHPGVCDIELLCYHNFEEKK